MRRFPHQRSLDGVRGLASLGVLCHHTFYTDLPARAWPWHIALLRAGALYGSYGVTLFFVLSGYLITSLLLLDRRRPHFFANFYWKRFFRILPALLLVLAAAWSLGLIGVTTALLAVFFVYNFHDLLHIPATGPYWSLSIEEQFYLLWPMAVRRLSAQRLTWLLTGVAILQPVLRFVSIARHHGRLQYTFTNSDGIVWGALLAMAALRWRVPYPGGSDSRLWHRFGMPLLLVGLACIVPSEILLWHGIQSYALTLDGVVLLFAGGLCYVITHRDGWVSRLLALPPLVFFGNISYMFYLSHGYVLQLYVSRVQPRFHTGDLMAVYVQFLFVLLVTTALCTVSLYLFERPVGSLRRYLLHASTVQAKRSSLPASPGRRILEHLPRTS